MQGLPGTFVVEANDDPAPSRVRSGEEETIMAGVSKNQRVSKKPSTGPYVEQAGTTRLVPLGAGHCYLRDPRDGRTHHVKVGSPRFRELMTEVAAVTGVEARLTTELSGLAARYGGEWPAARDWFAKRNDEVAADSVEPAVAG